MRDLSDYPITMKWPAAHPDKIQLYSLPTPNGVKISIMLEETGLPYEPHLVRFENNGQLSPEFVSLNPNNKIPAIIDPRGPGGKPLPLWESGAILLYLADKSRSLILEDAPGRYETIQWLMFQVGGVGPMFGQVGSTNSPARNTRTSAPATVMWRKQNVCWASSIDGCRSVRGSWAMPTRSPISPSFRGSTY